MARILAYLLNVLVPAGEVAAGGHQGLCGRSGSSKRRLWRQVPPVLLFAEESQQVAILFAQVREEVKCAQVANQDGVFAALYNLLLHTAVLIDPLAACRPRDAYHGAAALQQLGVGISGGALCGASVAALADEGASLEDTYYAAELLSLARCASLGCVLVLYLAVSSFFLTSLMV